MDFEWSDFWPQCYSSKVSKIIIFCFWWNWLCFGFNLLNSYNIFKFLGGVTSYENCSVLWFRNCMNWPMNINIISVSQYDRFFYLKHQDKSFEKNPLYEQVKLKRRMRTVMMKMMRMMMRLMVRTFLLNLLKLSIQVIITISCKTHVCKTILQKNLPARKMK